jgi:hypothetical protein
VTPESFCGLIEIDNTYQFTEKEGQVKGPWKMWHGKFGRIRDLIVARHAYQGFFGRVSVAGINHCWN